MNLVHRLGGLGVLALLIVIACSEDALIGPRFDSPGQRIVPAGTVTLQDLGTLPGGKWARAHDINEAGQVTGVSDDGFSESAIIWTAGGGMQALPPLPGGERSQAWAINDLGHVVGSSWDASSFDRPTLWVNGVPTDLGLLPGHWEGEARDIDNAGRIVGISSDGVDPRAVLWENGTITDLGTLGGPAARAEGVGAGGVIVGASYDGSGSEQAFSYQGSMQSLPTLPTIIPPFGSAHAIDASMRIVGYSSTGFGPRHAVVWESGIITDLGTLPGHDESSARDISDSGRVVGWSRLGSGDYTPVLWYDGTVIDLGSPGGESIAFGINESDQIVGFSGGPGVWRALLWTVTLVQDTDGDGVADDSDNCANDANTDQTDFDADGLGDVCDGDDDGDGYDDADEIAAGSDPLDPASTPEVCDGSDNDLDGQVDEGYPNTDGDSFKDCVDDDDDGDRIEDVVDVEPLIAGNRTFSDIPLGGSTAGTIIADAGRTITIREMPNPEGVWISVGGSGGPPAKIKLDNKASVVSFHAGAYVLTDPDYTSTVFVEEGGPAEIEMSLNDVPVFLVVKVGASVTYTETLDEDGNLVGLEIDEVSGDVTLNGDPVTKPVVLVGPPEDKNACKKGGWSQFNFPKSFKNQGQCIQYVNTGK